MRIGVYILKCSNGRFYVGSTQDMDVRLTEHKTGRVKATKNLLPIDLALFQPCDTLLEARRIEYRVKQLKSRKLVERMISEREIRLKA